MRKIKFRGWHVSQKKMFSAEEMSNDQLTLLPTGSFINVSSVSTKLSVIYPVNEFIPLQYTGVRDKNGKEIYEGDTLRVKMGADWQTMPMIVRNIWDVHVWKNESDGYMRVNDMEIIGNIYENPKLIERKK